MQDHVLVVNITIQPWIIACDNLPAVIQLHCLVTGLKLTTSNEYTRDETPSSPTVISPAILSLPWSVMPSPYKPQ